jgi:hypothetical protein
MNKPLLTLATLVFFKSITSFAQEAIDVTDQTIKVGGFKEEELYFGFAEGDKLIFSFEEAGKKELKEIEIVEYPGNSKFSDFKTRKIEKTITVSKQSVYIFRFKNSAMAGRICKIKIQRIPLSEATKNFNTTASWITKQDTTWNTYTKDVIIGYDTAYLQKTKKELVKVDTIINPLFDKTLRVHSETAMGKTQFTPATVQLPANAYYPNAVNPYKSTEVVSWSYWLGVGQKAKEDYEKANQALSTGIKTLGALTGYGALASLAVTGISLFANTTVGDNVQYKFYGVQNNKEIIIDYGNVVSASGRNERIIQGSFSVQLFNDNFKDGIDVNLKMVVVQVNKEWKDVSHTEQQIIPKTEKQLFKEPVIKTSRIAMAGL